MEKHKNLEAEALKFVEEAIVIYDRNGFLTYYNKQFQELYSYKESDLFVGVHFSKLGEIDLANGNVVVTEDFGGREEYLALKAEYRKSLMGSFVVQLQDGRFIKTTDRSLPDGGFISVQTDVTAFKSIELQVKLKNDQLQQVNSELQTLVNTDVLTGCLSRREIIVRTNLSISNYNSNGCSILICVIDVDNFKKINDEFGYMVGDEALQRVASLRFEFAFIKHFGRLGGDEFLMVIELSEDNKLFELFGHIREFLHKTSLVVNGKIQNVPIAISCGAIQINENMISLEDCYNDISKALLVSKKEGKNKFHLI